MTSGKPRFPPIRGPAEATVRSFLQLTLGAFILAFGLNAFVIANRLTEGGVTGISVVLFYLTGVPVGALYFALNIPLLAWGWRLFGRGFAARTLAGIGLLSMALWLTRDVRFANPDLMLSSIYGGATVGLGLGLMFRSGGSSGGLDIIAKLLKEKHAISISESFLALDALILGGSALVIGSDKALYSLIVTFIAGRVVDFVQEGPRRAKAALVISDHPDEVAKLITTRLERGATVLQGTGAFTGADKRVVMTVLSRRELVRLKDEVRAIDPKAFVIIADIAEVLGEGF